MEVNKNIATQFNDKLELLKIQFLIGMDRYRTALKTQYLEGKDTTVESQKAENLLNDIYSKAFILTGEVNANILENNSKIQSMDEYLKKLKTKVEKEDTKLATILGSQSASIPREKDSKVMVRKKYLESGVYFASILGTMYIIYRYYSK